MKYSKKFTLVGFTLIMSTLLTACSDDAEQPTTKKETSSDHVWKVQTDALKAAKDVAGIAQKSLNQHKDKLDATD